MSRLYVNCKVMVHPSHSLKFAKRWGYIEEIHPNDSLPIKVRFDGLRLLYGFSPEELLSEHEVIEWEKKNTRDYCSKCGKDITGEYSYLCEDCAFPIFKEESL